ncbi:MAG: polysaccharide deacetylase family protein [Bacillota bacterium]
MRGRVWAWGSTGHRFDLLLASEAYLAWLILVVVTLTGYSGIPWIVNVPGELYVNLVAIYLPGQGEVGTVQLPTGAEWLPGRWAFPQLAEASVEIKAVQTFPDAPIHSVPQAGKKIALTFDDGPYRYWTEAYLTVLEREQVPATFFLVGKRVGEYPQLVLSVVEKGHDVGNHSFSHRRMTDLQYEEVEREIAMAAMTISGITFRPVQLFRPPYGSYSNDIVKSAREQSSYTIAWSVDPRDWNDPGAEKLVQRVVAGTRDGSIILLHEGKPHTLDALPKIIKELRNRGYEFVSVSELLRSAKN